MTTLSAAADVLRCYSDERRDLTVTQVSRLLEMPKSNASRLLRAMSACGLLEPVGATKRYRPGVAVHEAGRQYRLTSPFAIKLDEAAQAVGDKLGDAVEMICVVERDGPLVLCVAERAATGPLLRPAGTRRTAAAAAPGHALLARLRDDDISALISRAAAGFAPIAGSGIEEVSRHVALARRRGFASLPDARGRVEIAVALGDPQARKEAALTVVTRDNAAAAAVIDIARSLHEACGALASSLRDPVFRSFDADAA